MTIQMTRKEYEQKFGNAPVINTSEIDSEPVFADAPVQMSREEYNTKYKLSEPSAATKSAMTFKPWFPAEDDDGILETGLKATGNVIPSAINLGAGLLNLALNPIDTAKSVFSITKGSGEKIGREILERTPLKGRVEQVPESESEQAFNQMFGFFKDNYYGTENLQRTATNDPFGVGIDILTTLAGGAGTLGKLEKATDVLDKAIDVSRIPGEAIATKAKQLIKPVDKIVANRADEIRAIESNYSKLRKLNDANTEADASRIRIAKTDVLSGAVDDNGLIRTTQKGGPVDQYRKLFIDGYENVVRQNLDREGAIINLNEVRKGLIDNIYSSSRLEGADLVAAINKIDKEIKGLSVRADAFGNVPLTKLHDAKIATTKNIDYTKPLSQTYRKAVANTYKTLIENKSTQPIKKINGQLATYYGDLERLRNLDGRKVKGGKLGKYFAQTTGNIAGGIAGSFGGPVGTVAGTVIGGEVSSALKGKTLARTFGKELGLEAEKNAILETAKRTGTLPKVRNLKTPDIKVGAAKNIPKTDEIIRIEKLIDRNIKQQKVAIAAKNFTLVEKLKDVYNSLVEMLVSAIESVKNTPNRTGGFVKNPLAKTASKSDDITSSISKAKASGQSFDEWVKGQGNKTYYHTTSSDIAPQIEKGGFKAQVGERSMGTTKGNGVFLYESVEPTKNFGKNFIWKGKEPVVIETKINGKIYNSKSQSKSINSLAEDTELIKKLQSEGFVGIRGTEDGTPVTFVFNEKALKTRSQLKAEWDKVNQ